MSVIEWYHEKNQMSVEKALHRVRVRQRFPYQYRITHRMFVKITTLMGMSNFSTWHDVERVERALRDRKLPSRADVERNALP